MEWHGEERRRHMDTVEQIAVDMEQLKRQHSEMLVKLSALEEAYALMKPAFVRLIDSESAHKRLRQAIVEKSLVGIVWGAIILVGLSLWNFIAQHIHHVGK